LFIGKNGQEDSDYSMSKKSYYFTARNRSESFNDPYSLHTPNSS